MIIGRIGMTINLVTTIPLNVLPCRREVIFSLIKPKDGISKPAHFVLTVVILGSSSILGILFPDIINAFSILGGFAATTIVIFFPGMIYIAITKKKMIKDWK